MPPVTPTPETSAPAAVAGSQPTTDPVTIEIIRGALRAIQSEMEALIERTAMSPFIREKRDFYAALFDAGGQLIAGSNLPVFGDVVGPVTEYSSVRQYARHIWCRWH